MDDEPTPIPEVTEPLIDASETEVVEAPEAVAEANPTIIIESPSDDAAPEAELERAVETAISLERLATDISDLYTRLASVEQTAEEARQAGSLAAEAVGDVAAVQEVIGDAVAESVEEELDIEPDEAPSTAGRHFMFKSWKEWRGK